MENLNFRRKGLNYKKLENLGPRLQKNFKCILKGKYAKSQGLLLLLLLRVTKLYFPYQNKSKLYFSHIKKKVVLIFKRCTSRTCTKYPQVYMYKIPSSLCTRKLDQQERELTSRAHNKNKKLQNETSNLVSSCLGLSWVEFSFWVFKQFVNMEFFISRVKNISHMY